MLTREDANSESALLSEWLVDDRAVVRKGQPVCVVETSKAPIESTNPIAPSRTVAAPPSPRSSTTVPVTTAVRPG